MTNNNCANCAFFDRFFRKRFCKFREVREGICNKSNKIVDEYDICKIYLRANTSTIPILEMLDKSIDDINYIKNFYEEEDTDN